MSRRVVFDTSTLVSAALLVGSVPHQALVAAFATSDLCASVETLNELERVLLSEKFDRYLSRSLRERFVSLVQRSTRTYRVEAKNLDDFGPRCRDPNDEIFLALSRVCEADVLVSSDEDLLTLHPWRGIAIIRPLDFLRLPIQSFSP